MEIRKLDEVTPPKALTGDTCRVLNHGKWVKADVVDVRFERQKDGRRYVWRWVYGVLINGTFVVRQHDQVKDRDQE